MIGELARWFWLTHLITPCGGLVLLVLGYWAGKDRERWRTRARHRASERANHKH